MSDVEEIFQTMYIELNVQYPELVEEEKAQVVQILNTWANAKIELLNCSSGNKAVAQEIITSCQCAINNLICAIQAKKTNLIIEKVQYILKSLLEKYILYGMYFY